MLSPWWKSRINGKKQPSNDAGVETPIELTATAITPHFYLRPKCDNLINNYWMRLSTIAIIRDLKQIASAGADTAAGSKFPPK